ncbi:MAG: tRNA (N6-isopentenyl adenosine(37)-C2)-methylthiotransferase MiaB [Nitrospirae bacterium]|nr:tRNA (N6-isopentenyl adenosine(37)-C2)-methylthiotransferase MiaB [Nitrospirota bacterium]
MAEESEIYKENHPKVFILTFGCQMNVHDSEKIAGIFSEYGYGQTKTLKSTDVIVINTCSVREKAEQKFYSELGRLRCLKEKNPDLKILVAGCIAQQKGEDLFKRFPYVDLVFGPQSLNSLQKWIKEKSIRIALSNDPEYHLKTLPLKREGQVRGWVSIMYGCDNFCSYCIVPYTRGRERSRPGKDICNEVKALAEKGFKEITLLGQNVNSYGKGFAEDVNFPRLLYLIHNIEGIQRIRFVTSHPRDLSNDLIKAMRELPKICEHIHLPLQAGSDKVLSMMNRGYTYIEYKEKIDRLREAIPDISITTDIIVGFPGEGEEDFQCTLRALEEIEFDGIFAFKYSKRPKTAALNLPDHISEKIKAQRLSMVLNLQDSITYKKNKTLEGKTLEVLVEGLSETDKDKLTGRTRANKIVNFYGNSEHIGNRINIKILEAKQHSLYGEVESRE